MYVNASMNYVYQHPGELIKFFFGKQFK